jgi:hypothetical protein
MDALRQRKANRHCALQVVLTCRVAAKAATTRFNIRLSAIGHGSLRRRHRLRRVLIVSESALRPARFPVRSRDGYCSAANADERRRCAVTSLCRVPVRGCLRRIGPPSRQPRLRCALSSNRRRFTPGGQHRPGGLHGPCAKCAEALVPHGASSLAPRGHSKRLVESDDLRELPLETLGADPPTMGVNG